MTQGIREFEPARRDWQERLEALRDPEGQPLAPCLRAELLRECRRLRQVMEMIAEIEAEQKAVAAAEDGPAARLARLRGIGTTFAAVLGNEVFFRTFRNRREVGGDLGRAPSPWQSGGIRRDQGIAKSGNPGRGAPPSSWPGCGCDTSPPARSRSGSMLAWARQKGGCAGSCWWRWHAS